MEDTLDVIELAIVLREEVIVRGVDLEKNIVVCAANEDIARLIRRS